MGQYTFLRLNFFLAKAFHALDHLPKENINISGINLFADFGKLAYTMPLYTSKFLMLSINDEWFPVLNFPPVTVGGDLIFNSLCSGCI